MEITNLEGNTAARTLSESPSVEAIQQWMVNYLAQQLRLDPQEIDPKLSFGQYGIDSVMAISLTGELEDQLGFRLSPTLPYDYPTIETLAEHLAQTATGKPIAI